MKDGKNRRTKYRFLTGLFLLFVLAGCGKDAPKEYVDMQITGTDEKDGFTEGLAGTGDIFQGGGLRQSLMAEEVWKESFNQIVEKNGSLEQQDVEQSFFIEIPDVETMYVQHFKEHYLSGKEKKAYAEYFLEKDSIYVDTDNFYFPCKENFTERRNRILEEGEVYFGNLPEEKLKQDSQYRYLKNRLEYIEQKLEIAPKKKDADSAIGDYDADCYAGIRDNKLYSLRFTADEEEKDSSVRLMPVNTYDFAPAAIKEAGTDFFYASYFYKESGTNICSLSMEEARRSAERIIEDLGLLDLQLYTTGEIRWFTEGQTITDGYAFLFSRRVGSLLMDNHIYGMNMEGEYLPVYNVEYCLVEVGDEGLLQFFYTGILEPTDEAYAVKLLAYENVKEVFRKAFADMSFLGGTQHEIQLCYMRMRGETPGSYVILPVWQYKPYHLYSVADDDPVYNNLQDSIFINAMDGSLIDAQAEGFGQYRLVWLKKQFDNQYENDIHFREY